MKINNILDVLVELDNIQKAMIKCDIAAGCTDAREISERSLLKAKVISILDSAYFDIDMLTYAQPGEE